MCILVYVIFQTSCIYLVVKTTIVYSTTCNNRLPVNYPLIIVNRKLYADQMLLKYVVCLQFEGIG